VTCPYGMWCHATQAPTEGEQEKSATEFADLSILYAVELERMRTNYGVTVTEHSDNTVLQVR
jgi:hypothetical protein